MKIALCLSGLVGSRAGKNGVGEQVPPEIAAEHYKKSIINADPSTEVDVFMHSWSTDFGDELISLYEPRDYLFERQKNFDDVLIDKLASKRLSIGDSVKNEFLKIFDRKVYDSVLESRLQAAFRGVSRWYSNKQAISLAVKYAEERHFMYDFIMISRFDVEFYTAINFKEYDSSKIWVSNWNDFPTHVGGKEPKRNNLNQGHRLMDLWFFSGHENMRNFCGLYDRVEYYSRSPHVSSLEHIRYLNLDVSYTMYRWYDYDLIRRSRMGALV